MKNVRKALIATLLLLSVFSMAIAETSGLMQEEQSKAKRILVIETTDIHGYIKEFDGVGEAEIE